MCIKTDVLSLLKKYRTNDPFMIAKEKNVIVLYENLGSIMGYHNYDSRFHFIHINNQITEAEKRFTCAHELGHVVLHPKTNTSFLKRMTLFSADRIERQANTFAVELLMPDSLLKEYEGYSIYALANMVGIPTELVGLKRM